LASPQEFTFVDYVVNPMWTGKSEIWHLNMTRDGKVYRNETQLLLFGSYFFMSEEGVIHSRTVENLMQVIGDFGGVLEVVLFAFVFTVTMVNEKQMLAKSIRAIYFQNDASQPLEIKHIQTHEDGCEVIGGVLHKSLKPIKFNMFDKWSEYKSMIYCCKAKNK